MTTSIIDSESVLALDIGSVNTRAALFDVVESQYHFIGMGVAPTTVNAPYRDVSEGALAAIVDLQAITGRVFMDKDARLLVPSQANGTGVDRMVVVYSAGPELRIVTAGLLGDVSLDSANRLASLVYGQVVDSLGLSDRRRPEQQVDALVRIDPNLIIMAGGTDHGANRSVLKLADLVVMLCRVLPVEKRPRVLYAGNASLAKRIKEGLEKWTRVETAPNVRPSLDNEDVFRSLDTLSGVVTDVRSGQFGGLQQLGSYTSLPPAPLAQGYGRIIRFLSQVYDPGKGVLGVDVGSRHTTLAAAFGKQFTMQVHPYGLGSGMQALIKAGRLEEIARWLPVKIGMSTLRDYLWQKTIHPGLIPTTNETLAMEQAAARVALQLSLSASQGRWAGRPNCFEPILASGSVFSRAAAPWQALLTLLDGLQPAGVTIAILDQNNLLGMLGAVAKVNPVLAVQVVESGALQNLGTVICPISDARPGVPIMRVRLEYEGGGETQVEIKQGSLVSLPVQPGQAAKIYLQALRRTLIDPVGRRSMLAFKILGGACGAVVDARGRPLQMSDDEAQNRALNKKWQAALGASA